MSSTKVAVIGSGNIGSDLVEKILRSPHLTLAMLVGIDPDSDGLLRARNRGIPVTHEGIEGLITAPDFGQIEIVFDATSAGAHPAHNARLQPFGKRVIDLTPAAIGPYVVPPVNLTEHIDAPNINLVTCGGQATIPIVAAVNSTATVLYAEIVASIASRSAGPGTRANIDEFTTTTARAIQTVGRAQRSKAIINLNPAEPALIMTDTVICLTHGGDPETIRRAVTDMVAAVSTYVPGYRLKQDVQVDPAPPDTKDLIDGTEATWQVTTFLEVEGAGDYLPPFAGNLDIITATAIQVAELIAQIEGAAAA